MEPFAGIGRETHAPIALEQRQGDLTMDNQAFHKRLADWQMMTGSERTEVETKCEALCTLYVDASNEQRLQLIHLFRTPPPGEKRPPFAPFDQLFSYIYTVARRIQSEKDVYPVYLGLAAAAIAGDYPDFRDARLAWDHLRSTAARAGIDPNVFDTQIVPQIMPMTREKAAEKKAPIELTACPSCNRPLRSGARFCFQCGSFLTDDVSAFPLIKTPGQSAQYRCFYCKAPLQLRDPFCGTCGRRTLSSQWRNQ